MEEQPFPPVSPVEEQFPFPWGPALGGRIPGELAAIAFRLSAHDFPSAEASLGRSARLSKASASRNFRRSLSRKSILSDLYTAPAPSQTRTGRLWPLFLSLPLSLSLFFSLAVCK